MTATATSLAYPSFSHQFFRRSSRRELYALDSRETQRLSGERVAWFRRGLRAATHGCAIRLLEVGSEAYSPSTSPLFASDGGAERADARIAAFTSSFAART